jgi:integrase
MQTLIQEYATKIESERGKLAAQQARYMLTRLNLTGVTGRELDAARTALRAQVSANSANRIITEARSFLHWARKTERLSIERNAIDDCLGFYPAEKIKVELPTQEQLRKLIELVLSAKRYRTDNARFVSLCLFAGLRPGEAETLEPRHIVPKFIHVKHPKTGVERHAYYTHSAVLKPLGLRLAALPQLLASHGRHFLPVAFRQAGWASDTRNTLRKLCVSYYACSGRFSEYEMAQQFGHSSVVSMQYYRDRSILDVIRPGDCIEEWMGIEDMAADLRKAAIGTPILPSNSADSPDATPLSLPALPTQAG